VDAATTRGEERMTGATRRFSANPLQARTGKNPLPSDGLETGVDKRQWGITDTRHFQHAGLSFELPATLPTTCTFPVHEHVVPPPFL
jgi:hypothetical protein